MFGKGCKHPTAPGIITTLSASDDLISKVVIDFSKVSGYPEPAYNLYEDDVLVEQGITPPHEHAVASGTRDYYVKAVNDEGETDSNADEGTSIQFVVPSEITDLEATDDVFREITVEWTDSTGVPKVIQDIYQDNILIRSRASSPYVIDIAPGTYTYRVEASNEYGTAVSNNDNGTATEGTLPGEITDFTADDGEGHITIDFSLATGEPVPTYDLYEDGTMVESGVYPGYVRNVGDGNRDYMVKAINYVGEIDSNENSAISGDSPGTINNLVASDGEGYVDISFSTVDGYPEPTYDLYENDNHVASDISSGYNRNVGNGTRDYMVKAINQFGTTNSNENAAMSGESPGSFSMSMTSPMCAWWEVNWNYASGYPTPDYYWYTTAYPNDGVDLNEGDSPHVHGCMQGFSGTCIMEASNQFGTSESNHLSVYCYPCAEAEAREKISYLVASGKLDIMSKNKKDT